MHHALEAGNVEKVRGGDELLSLALLIVVLPSESAFRALLSEHSVLNFRQLSTPLPITLFNSWCHLRPPLIDPEDETPSVDEYILRQVACRPTQVSENLIRHPSNKV